MNLRSLLVLSAAAVGLSVTAHASVETYEIDPVHSSVAFNIRHFFTPVAGSFTKFSGTIKADRDNPQNNSVEASIQIASIDTRNTKRDDDLRSARFFDAEKFPTVDVSSVKASVLDEISPSLSVTLASRPRTISARPSPP